MKVDAFITLMKNNNLDNFASVLHLLLMLIANNHISHCVCCSSEVSWLVFKK